MESAHRRQAVAAQERRVRQSTLLKMGNWGCHTDSSMPGTGSVCLSSQSSQSVSYFTVPPRAHPCLEGQAPACVSGTGVFERAQFKRSYDTLDA